MEGRRPAKSPPEATAFDDSAWSTINVPHDISITLVSTSDSDPGAMGWYRKHFTLPPGFAGKKVIVQFDGVYEDSKIYLNGTQIGNQRFGYISFNCDLTPYLNATGDNVLSVFVDNLTSRRSHFYSGTGIYRHVWLIATDKECTSRTGERWSPRPLCRRRNRKSKCRPTWRTISRPPRRALWKRRFTTKPARR